MTEPLTPHNPCSWTGRQRCNVTYMADTRSQYPAIVSRFPPGECREEAPAFRFCRRTRGLAT